MAITLTLEQLVEASSSLRIIGGFSIPDVKASYALAKIKRQANGPLADLEEARVTLCLKHAKRNEKNEPEMFGDKYLFTDINAFETEWKALLAESVTLDGVRPLQVSEFDGATRVYQVEKDGKPGEMKNEIIRGIEPDVLFNLGPFVAEPSPSDTAK